MNEHRTHGVPQFQALSCVSAGMTPPNNSSFEHSAMEAQHRTAYLAGMHTTGIQQRDIPRCSPETDADQRARIEREDAIIAKAEADIDAGLGIEDDAVEAWLDSLDHDPDAPLPPPDSRPTFR